MKNHKIDLYNILLFLSRNIFFYKKIKLSDTFETRIYLMFFHFAILMIVSKKKGIKFDQNNYDYLFNNIENNLTGNSILTLSSTTSCFVESSCLTGSS